MAETKPKSRVEVQTQLPQVQPDLKQVEQIVDKWFSDQFHNSVVSRDTAVHNLLLDAKPALIKALADVLGQTQE